jgi:hypothetical protein
VTYRLLLRYTENNTGIFGTLRDGNHSRTFKGRMAGVSRRDAAAPGAWSEEEYLILTAHRNRLVEFTDGFLEPPPASMAFSVCVTSFLGWLLY